MKKNKPQGASAQDVQAAKMINLREKLFALPKVQQEAVANYFNMFNAAAWLYNEVLTPDAKDYVDESVSYAKELAQLESLPDTSDPQEFDQHVQKLNHEDAN